MTAKHVRLVPEERVYAEGNLLQAQIDIINASKRLKNFRLLRQEEANKKIELKSKISELKTELENMEKLLPKVAFKEERKEENKTQPKTQKERFELEDEIEEIRRKIRSLQSEY